MGVENFTTKPNGPKQKNKRIAIEMTAVIEIGFAKLMVQPNDFKRLGGNIRLSFGLK